jgi:hypothetical protein
MFHATGHSPDVGLSVAVGVTVVLGMSGIVLEMIGVTWPELLPVGKLAKLSVACSTRHVPATIRHEISNNQLSLLELDELLIRSP